MAFESFHLEGIQRPKKIRSVSAIAEYGVHLKWFLAALKGQTTSSAPIINHHRGFREGLETLTFSVPTNNHCRYLKEGLETQTSFVPTNNHCCGL